MTREEEVIRIAKKLDKMVSRNNTEGALDLLKELKSFNMTLKLLQETRIGMSVNGIRKHCTDEEVIALAKFLIKDWKRLLDSGNNEKISENKNGLEPVRSESPAHSSPSQSHSRRLDLRPDSDSDTKSPDTNMKEKFNSEHKRKRSHSNEAASPSYEARPVQAKPEKLLEEVKKQRAVEHHPQEADTKRPKHYLELQGEKPRSDQKREKPFEEHKIMKREEERRDKHPEMSKRHSSIDDIRRSREEYGHHRERPAEPHKPLFERKSVLDSLYPSRYPSPPRPVRPPRPVMPIKRPPPDAKNDKNDRSTACAPTAWTA